MTTSGIQTASFQVVGQGFNKVRHPVPFPNSQLTDIFTILVLLLLDKINIQFDAEIRTAF